MDSDRRRPARGSGRDRATLLLVQPVLALLAGVALLHERPGITQLIGCAVVICAGWVVSVGPGWSRDVGDVFGKRSAVRGDGPVLRNRDEESGFGSATAHRRWRNRILVLAELQGERIGFGK